MINRRKPRAAAGRFSLPPAFKLSDRDFDVIRALVKKKTGINLGLHKRDLVVSRLARRLRELGLENFSQYTDYLRSVGGDAEMVNMINRITTNKTDFFREAHHFKLLTDRILPQLVEQGQARGKKVLRCWSAACSSGEEPYSLAITLHDFFRNQPGWDVKILASDLDTNMLRKASAGIYSSDVTAPVPRNLLARHFSKIRESGQTFFEVKEHLRKMILFRKFNLMTPVYPLKTPLDFVFCRNVLIYFDAQDKKDIVTKLHAVIKPGGHIFIGHSESLMMVKDLFRFIATTMYERL